MAACSALSTTAGLLNLEFQAAGFAFKDISNTHVAAIRHFVFSFDGLKDFRILVN